MQTATSREDLLIQRERLRVALQRIQGQAASDAPAEELEDAQRDLRRIHEIASDALKE